MAQSVDTDDLREWLAHVDESETTQFLMVAIAHDQGVSASDLASWYGRSTDEIDDWLDELERRPLPVSIAAREGIDFKALADASGLNRRTIVDWFGSLASSEVTQAADVIRRYSQQSPGPLLGGTESRVFYLNHEVLAEHGWSLEDEDLFEKAADVDLDLEDYGRFLVKPGETILEAAEKRGRSWPYACRGGACANCAVIVTEGDVAMPGQTVLTENQVTRLNARLACVGVPATSELYLVYNVQHLEQFEDLRLPSPLTDAEPLQ